MVRQKKNAAWVREKVSSPYDAAIAAMSKAVVPESAGAYDPSQSSSNGSSDRVRADASLEPMCLFDIDTATGAADKPRVIVDDRFAIARRLPFSHVQLVPNAHAWHDNKPPQAETTRSDLYMPKAAATRCVKADDLLCLEVLCLEDLSDALPSQTVTVAVDSTVDDARPTMRADGSVARSQAQLERVHREYHVEPDGLAPAADSATARESPTGPSIDPNRCQSSKIARSDVAEPDSARPAITVTPAPNENGQPRSPNCDATLRACRRGTG